MFVYGVCVGPSGRYEQVLQPSLAALGLGPVITRRHQHSIFVAYNSILDEATTRWPELEGVVLIHEDVRVQDPRFEETLRRVLALPRAGLVGVVGGRAHREMSWWKTDALYGHVEHATHVDDFSRGEHEVDTVDGLLMALSGDAARECRLNGRGYPGFHGYDSELCAVVRASGRRVLVADLDVFHDCKPTAWEQPELWWTAYEWALRWRAAPPATRMAWRAKRLGLELRARYRGARTRA